MSKKVSVKQFLMRSGTFEKAYDCEKAIKDGKVTINGKVMGKPGFFFNPKSSLVRLEGYKIKRLSKQYFIMNKPGGYSCQKTKDGKSIYNVLRKEGIEEHILNTLFPIGRLDDDTEGLIIITNDGSISDAIANPKGEIAKKYHARLEKPIKQEDVKRLEIGVAIDVDGELYITKPAKISAVKDAELNISITEGKKRQVRKMFEAVGNKVAYLRRDSIGSLRLGDLKTGKIKAVTKEFILESCSS